MQTLMEGQVRLGTDHSTTAAHISCHDAEIISLNTVVPPVDSNLRLVLSGPTQIPKSARSQRIRAVSFTIKLLAQNTRSALSAKRENSVHEFTSSREWQPLRCECSSRGCNATAHVLARPGGLCPSFTTFRF